MSAPDVIDPQAIENLRALNPGDNDEFLREIVGIFLEDAPLRLRELNEALGANDTGKFTRAAHSIKGASSNIGANALRLVAEELEHRSKNEHLPSLAPLVESVQREFDRTKAELATLLG
jgi:HPt (histidine-containing phosphotransfer) domain-containing protein